MSTYIMLINSRVSNLLLCDKLMANQPPFVLRGAEMSWEARWKILADVITDLLGHGKYIPPNVINDLRSAKVMLEVVKADRSRSENIARLEEYLSDVESYVLSAARDAFGENYVNNVLSRLCVLEAEELEVEASVRFQPGLPRGKKWVRIQVTDEIPLDFIKRVADGLGLNVRVDDGYALIFGGDKDIKDFIKKVSEKMRESRGANLKGC